MNIFNLHADIGASSLKKGIFFCPDPYVKFRIVAADESVVVRHQEQHCRTNVRRNTVDPMWDGEVGINLFISALQCNIIFYVVVFVKFLFEIVPK